MRKEKSLCESFLSDDEVKRTVIGLIIGIIIWTILLCIICLIASCITGWSAEYVKILLGFICGGALASFMAFHIAASLNKAVELDEQGAENHTRKTYAIRTAIVLTIAVLLFFTGWVNILAVFVGIFGLKPAAYLVPVLGKIFPGKDK